MTFSLRRKLPTTAACATVRRRPTATKKTRTFFAALAAGLALSNPASAQLGQPTAPSVEPQYHKIVNFSRPAEFQQAQQPRGPEYERTETVVQPDAQQTIMRTQFQLQTRNKAGDDDAGFVIRTDLPGPERLFDARKSESMMREYIRRDAGVRTGQDRILFPEYPPISTDTYTGRQFARSTAKVEPNYICHGRLFFEQPNFERAGWDIGYLTPGLNVGVYYYDLFMLPYHSGTNPCVRYDCNVGKCQPGDATPFYCYREPFSVSGLTFQTLAIGTGFFAFP